jgi:hypothetical protein
MTFTPSLSTITNITQAIPAVVTTEQNHGLFDGNVVRLKVPQNYGMFQLNNLQLQVMVLSTTTFSCWYLLYPEAIPVNSTQFPAFTIPSKPGFTANVSSMGSGPTPKSNVPWQVQNEFFDTPLTDQVLNNSTTEIPF